MDEITKDVLRGRFKLPLSKKIQLTRSVIQRFHKELAGKTYVSFSGGKDSTVLLDLVRKEYPETLGVFIDTGLEYPEIRDFVKTKDNIHWVKPDKTFREVIEKYGFPLPTKELALKIEAVRRNPNNKIAHYYLTGYRSDGVYCRRAKISDKWMFLIDAPFKISYKCCNYLKKYPVRDFEKQCGLKPYIGNMASDSGSRLGYYLNHGCTSFEKGKEKCMPLSWWTEDDIWAYIKNNKLPYSSIYDNGLTRTGCMFCLFGIHLEKGMNRFQLMQLFHPKHYDYCINKLGIGKVLDYIKIPYRTLETYLENTKVSDIMTNTDREGES